MTGIASALLAFQADAPSLQKDAINPHFKNKYVSLDSLIEQVLPVLNKHGLVLIQKPTLHPELGHPALVTKIIHADSGESEEALMPLAMAKNDPQGQGSAITYARRYALMAFLGLVADSDDDGHTATKANKKETEDTAWIDRLKERIGVLCAEADAKRDAHSGTTHAEVVKRAEASGWTWATLDEVQAAELGGDLRDWLDVTGCAEPFTDFEAVKF